MQQISLDFEKAEKAPEPIAESSEPQVFSISEINKAIRRSLEGQFQLIWVRGEISNFKAHTSGHFYFSLKDATAQVNAVMFKGFNQRLKFKPHDGLEVLVRGKITVYEPRGNYQIFCELMEPVGAGALQKAFEQLKAKLQAEGLFESSRKRPLPAFPRHVAVVTSPTGAAIRDILNILRRRSQSIRVTLVPVLVQGEQAPASIVEGIYKANLLKDVDVMIVGRGGGSIEDLWAFNNEGVARALAASRVPTISAVGHEVDFTVADFVADLRAPTPSAAAELVVKNTGEVMDRIQLLTRQLRQAMQQRILLHKKHWQQLSLRLSDPRRKLQESMQRCDELTQRLQSAVERYLVQRRTAVDILLHRLGTPKEVLRRLQEKIHHLVTTHRQAMSLQLRRKGEKLGQLTAVLDSLSPLKVVERGYSLVTRQDEIIKSATQLNIGDSVNLRFAHGEAEAQIMKIKKN